MKAKIVIKMDNAAFGDCRGIELARILRVMADKFDNEDTFQGQELSARDINGNTVGSLVII